MFTHYVHICSHGPHGKLSNTFTEKKHTLRIHTQPVKLAGRVRRDMHSLDLLISHTGLHLTPADEQMGNSAHWVLQIGGETVDTAGYTE